MGRVAPSEGCAWALLGRQGTLVAGWWDDNDRVPWWWGDRVTMLLVRQGTLGTVVRR